MKREREKKVNLLDFENVIVVCIIKWIVFGWFMLDRDKNFDCSDFNFSAQ